MILHGSLHCCTTNVPVTAETRVLMLHTVTEENLIKCNLYKILLIYHRRHRHHIVCKRIIIRRSFPVTLRIPNAWVTAALSCSQFYWQYPNLALSRVYPDIAKLEETFRAPNGYYVHEDLCSVWDRWCVVLIPSREDLLKVDTWRKNTQFAAREEAEAVKDFLLSDLCRMAGFSAWKFRGYLQSAYESDFLFSVIPQFEDIQPLKLSLKGQPIGPSRCVPSRLEIRLSYSVRTRYGGVRNTRQQTIWSPSVVSSTSLLTGHRLACSLSFPCESDTTDRGGSQITAVQLSPSLVNFPTSLGGEAIRFH
jgi:hypothetical protein